MSECKTAWKYLKGSEKDFEGAPEWATMLVSGGEFVGKWFLESFVAGNQQHIRNDGKVVFLELENDSSEYEIIAQREPITNVTVNISALCGEGDLNDCIDAPESRNKYLREIKPGVLVDVYDVLMAWTVINPALQHLIKKALQTGERGHKTREQDLQDIIDSAIRAKELEQK